MKKEAKLKQILNYLETSFLCCLKKNYKNKSKCREKIFLFENKEIFTN